MNNNAEELNHQQWRKLPPNLPTPGPHTPLIDPNHPCRHCNSTQGLYLLQNNTRYVIVQCAACWDRYWFDSHVGLGPLNITNTPPPPPTRTETHLNNTPAARRITANTGLTESQRSALADLINVLNTCYDDLPAEAQSAVRDAIAHLEQ